MVDAAKYCNSTWSTTDYSLTRDWTQCDQNVCDLCRHLICGSRTVPGRRTVAHGSVTHVVSRWECDRHRGPKK